MMGKHTLLLAPRMVVEKTHTHIHLHTYMRTGLEEKHRIFVFPEKCKTMRQFSFYKPVL